VLDPKLFFRANRQTLINIHAVHIIKRRVIKNC
jgi:DNA-binding LytR/AlgR family response regulator